jgi:hypothetical protein
VEPLDVDQRRVGPDRRRARFVDVDRTQLETAVGGRVADERAAAVQEGADTGVVGGVRERDLVDPGEPVERIRPLVEPVDERTGEHGDDEDPDDGRRPPGTPREPQRPTRAQAVG